MSVAPVVRYMILCNDWGIDPNKQNRVNIYGLLSHVSPGTGQFPVVLPQLSVFLALTEFRGTGEAQIRCVFEETGETVFESVARDIIGSADPLPVDAVSFRLRGFSFPQPGIYSIQFWYNDAMIQECPLRLRRSK